MKDIHNWLTDWLAHCADIKRLSPLTIKAYRRDVELFLIFIGDHLGHEVKIKDLDALTPSDFRAFLAWRRNQGVGGSTRARELSSLRTFYLYLGRQGEVKNSALSAISSPKRGHNIPRALSEKAAAMLIEEARKHSLHAKRAEWIGARDAAILLLLYGAGLRISEALKLNVEDIPTQAGAALRIIGKGDKERLVPILPVVRDAIKTYLRLCPFATEVKVVKVAKVAKEALFRAQSGRRLGARQVQLLMKNLRQSFNLSERATPHALRHSFATHLLGHGGDLRAIQELLGHASLSTTQIYAEIDTAQILSIYEKAHPRNQS